MHGTAPAPARKPLWRQQWALVLAGAVLGAVAGLAFPEAATGLKPLGDVFIALIKMTIAPLIFLVVVTGIAQVGDMRAVGRIGLKAFIYFEGVTTVCLGLSLVVAHYVHPGAGVARATARAGAGERRSSPAAQMTSLSAYLVAHGAGQLRGRLVRRRRRAAGAGAGGAGRVRAADAGGGVGQPVAGRAGPRRRAGVRHGAHRGAAGARSARSGRWRSAVGQVRLRDAGRAAGAGRARRG